MQLESTTLILCRYCHRELPLSEYYLNKRTGKNRDRKCKDCTRDYYNKQYHNLRTVRVPVEDAQSVFQVCSGCNQNLPLTSFIPNKGLPSGFTKQCKACSRKRANSRMDSTRKWLQEYKETQACEVCGETTPCCLDFHHRDPATKNDAIGSMAYRVSVARLKEEIAKCAIYCANCHRKHHAGILKSSTV